MFDIILAFLLLAAGILIGSYMQPARKVFVQEKIKRTPFRIVSPNQDISWEGECYASFYDGKIVFHFDNCTKAIQVGTIAFFDGRVWREIHLTNSYQPYLCANDSLEASLDFTLISEA